MRMDRLYEFTERVLLYLNVLGLESGVFIIFGD